MLYGSVGRVGLRALSGTSFSPLSLFANGEQGVWYQNSDFTTLFQDAAGTTPVTGYEQFVGLRLDKRSTSYSVAFDGTGDALSAAGTTNFQFGTGDFTVEAFVYITTLASGDVETIGGTYNGDQGGWLLYLASSCTKIAFRNGDAGIVTRDFSFSANTWHHVAVSRSSSTLRFFVDGVQVGADEASYTQNINHNNINGCAIGRYRLADGTAGGYIFGNISNLRVVKGTAVYTSNFTKPSAPLTQITNTVLLTCGVSGSVNPAITLFGDVRGSSRNPFTTATGNHAFQSTTTARAVLSARYNLLTYTEQFDNAAWVAIGTKNVSPNSTVAPDGTTTADTISDDNAAAFQGCQQGFTAVSGVTYTGSIYVKKTTGTPSSYPLLQIGVSAPSSFVAVIINTSAGTLYAVPSGGDYVAVTSSSITGVGDYWRVTLGYTANTTTPLFQFYPAASSNGTSLTSAATGSAIIWGADLRVANESSALPAYQRVGAAVNGTSTTIGTPDYDTVGFPAYLRYDGGDWYQTNSIDFTATDKMSVFAGVRKLSDPLQSAIIELSSAWSSNNGAFVVQTFGSNYQFAVRGTGNNGRGYGPYPAPVTDILTGQLRTSAANSAEAVVVNIDAAFNAGTTDSTAVSTGNFGNYPLYIGARAGTSNYFTGREYETIVLGRAVTATELANTEGYMETQTFGKDMSYVYSDELTTATGDFITAADGDPIYMQVSYV